MLVRLRMHQVFLVAVCITCKFVSLCKAHGCCCPAAVALQVKQATP